MGTQSVITTRASCARTEMAPDSYALQATLAVEEHVSLQEELAVKTALATVFRAVKEASAAQTSMAINIQSLRPPSACLKNSTICASPKSRTATTYSVVSSCKCLRACTAGR